MLPSLVVAVVTCLAPCPQDGAEAAPAAPRSLVLVTVDTLRREHLGCYGYPRPTSPRIDALAAESVQFEHAFATMATTFPSHLSILTGLYPHQHGSTSNRGAVRNPFEPAPGRMTAASALAAAGYRTAGFVSSVVLNARTGIHAGFGAFDAPGVVDGTRAAAETMQHALAWLAGVPASEPVFLWVHLWDTHEPNKPTEAFTEQFAVDDTLREWVKQRGLDVPALDAKFKTAYEVGERFFLMAKRERSPAERKNPPKYVRPQDARRAEQSAKPVKIDEPALLGLYARYDACVRQVDTEVGRLLDALAQRGALDRTILVFTADHGQSLGDNLLFGHGKDTQVNSSVPLLIRLPPALGVTPVHSSALVSLIDVLPTVLPRLGASGLEGFRSQLAGEDALAASFSRARIFTSETTEFHGAGEEQPYTSALLTGRWKYVRHAGGTGVLYDLAGAGEFVDVAAANAELVQDLARQLDAELASSVLGTLEEKPLDPEAEAQLERLKGLGYAGDD